MRILVLGKGDRGAVELHGHFFSFILTPKKTEPVPDLSTLDLVLFHISDDAKSNARFANVLDAWKNAGTIGKVIAISGGSLAGSEVTRLRELGDVPFIGGIDDSDAVLRLRWQVIEPQCSYSTARIARLLKEPDPALRALFILAQGLMCAGLRTTVDGKQLEYLDQNAWKRAEDRNVQGPSEKELLQTAASVLRLELTPNPAAPSGASLPSATTWKCCFPAGAASQIAGWLADEFGPITHTRTKAVLEKIAQGKAPQIWEVAASVPELKKVLQAD